MPYFGLLLFYDRVIALHDSKINVFQCPTTGFLLFYRTVLRVLATWDNCFNALFRAFFFSTYVKSAVSICWIMVSMPYFGLSSFLRERITMIKSSKLSFNALPRAFFFSTCKPYWKRNSDKECFNALPRAFFFSTRRP